MSTQRRQGHRPVLAKHQRSYRWCHRNRRRRRQITVGRERCRDRFHAALGELAGTVKTLSIAPLEGRSCHHRLVSSPLIEEGLAALRGGDAAAARRAFELALTEGESGEVLEGLAEALYLEREYVASAAHYERAFSAYRRERQSMAAGRAARTLAWITGNVLGDWAVRSGWLARARTILEEAGEDRPEHGWVLIIKAFSEPDAQVREALLRDAIAVGRRFGDPDIEFLALAHLGGLAGVGRAVQTVTQGSSARRRMNPYFL